MAVEGGGESSGRRTVVVGVKLDSHSRELLTWALVKVARVGDCVVAVHVLGNNETVAKDAKSSLLSLVKAFNSILTVYEGFCNQKQVDLKLKICRGSSARKILVREAKSHFADQLIVGTTQTHLTFRSSVSIAKYCAKKLSKECSVLAVNDGKIVFHRVSSPISQLIQKETEHHRPNSLLGVLQRSFSKNSKITNESNALKTTRDHHQTLKQNCSICCSSNEPSNDENKENNTLAIVPFQKTELPEPKPGWPLLGRKMISNTKFMYNSRVNQMSVVQWTMRLPSRYFLSIDQNSATKGSDSAYVQETGAIVPVGNGEVSFPSSPQSVSRELEGLHEKYSATCRLFKFQELVSATSNFMPENLIGKGGNSEVYRGCLPDGKELAVKILNPSEDASKEFVHEIEMITSLNHKNIISLFGFCFEDDHLVLVYDFLSRGSLEENLHGGKRTTSEFAWSERYKVAVSIAEALDSLHNRESQPVIHRDVKSSNILLSDDLEPQLSDFGLAKWASSTSSHITCNDVVGTFGYLAPEYFMHGKVNEKIDVYAYGVVLLELLSGRRPISSNCPKGQESLVMWAKPILNSEKFALLLDSNLGSSYDVEQVERMVLAASLCIRRAPRARPRMSLVLKLLQGDGEVTNWARLQVNASEGRDDLDDQTFSRSNLRSLLNLALRGGEEEEEDSFSESSIEQSVSLEDYLRGRWSHSSAFD